MTPASSAYTVALNDLVPIFERLGIAYQIGGSVASLAHGVARTTLDIDLIADVHAEHVAALAEQAAPLFYIDADDVAEAVAAAGSFNLIHLGSMFKVDVFVLKPTPYDTQAFLRADLKALDDAGDNDKDDNDAALFFVASAEDVILSKLRWYELGQRISTRQLDDVRGVLLVQGPALDVAYLRRWAGALHLTELLEPLLGEAGLA